MIKEIITNNVQTLESGSTFGRICHAFVSPETHWGDGTVCEVIVEIRNGKAVDIRLSYGAGGHNKGVTDLEVSLAIAEAFRLAAARLEQLYVQYDYRRG
jgi:hypothetical protein